MVAENPGASDREPDPDEIFRFSVTVHNQGNGPAPSTTLRYYLSDDSQVTTSDTQLDVDPIRQLPAFTGDTVSVELTAPSQAGTYYYEACVDPVPGESDDRNNCSPAVRVDVVTYPDLVVVDAVSDRQPDAGERFILSVTVQNPGNGPAPSTTLRYYLSDDSQVTTSDTQLDVDPLRQLPAFTGTTVSVELTAPSQAGTYYYGACIDPVPGESDTQNNCSSTLRVDVVTYPDLVVVDAVSDRQPDAGERFILSVTVQNPGNGPAPSTTLRYYLSDDSQVTTSDTQLDVDPLRQLPAFTGTTVSVELTAPSQAGTYYYGACVDPVPGESDDRNNCSSTLRVDVVTYPDLVVVDAVSDRQPDAGERFILSVTVQNLGNGPAPSTTLRYYISDDSQVTTSDTQLDVDPLRQLPAFTGDTVSVELTAPSQAGTYYYGACVDPVPGESDDRNNCSSTLRVDVVTYPDLVVVDAVSDRQPDAGERFSLSVTVQNLGNGPAPPTTLRYYLSDDSQVTTNDTQLDVNSLRQLPAFTGDTVSVELTAPSQAGTYYYGACVDPVPGESNTQNNCSSPLRIDIVTYPDLVATIRDRHLGNLQPGETFKITATIYNEGDGPAAPTTWRLYRSDDRGISRGDSEVRHLDNELQHDPSDGIDWALFNLSAPSRVGTYYYGVCVDAVPGESNTRNNCSDGVRLVVERPPSSPDLVATVTMAGDGGVMWMGEPSVNITASVENVGDGQSTSTTVRYYLSKNSRITPRNDEFLGERPVGPLPANSNSTHSIYTSAPQDEGTYYYYVCVNQVGGESNIGNNCQSSALVVAVLAPVWFIEQDTSCDVGLFTYTLEGAVYTRKSLRNVMVNAYAIDVTGSAHRLSYADLGNISANQRRDFSITERSLSMAAYPDCSYGLQWEY